VLSDRSFVGRWIVAGGKYNGWIELGNLCWVGTTHCQLGKARRNCVVVFGGSTGLLGGHNSLCTDRGATSTYRTIDSHELRTSMLATTRILVSKLATARVFCYPPTTPCSLTAPSLSPSMDLSVPTILSDKGIDISPNASDSGIWTKIAWWNRLLGWSWFPYFSVLCKLSFSHFNHLNVLFGFEKLGMWIGFSLEYGFETLLSYCGDIWLRRDSRLEVIIFVDVGVAWYGLTVEFWDSAQVLKLPIG